MAKHLTTNSLIASVRRRAMIPSNQSTFKEEDFLAFANEELDMGIVPHILSYHEDYLLQEAYITMSPSISEYPIPYRATGNKIREVSYVDVSGNIFEMTRIGVGDLPFYQNGSSGMSNSGIRAFYIEGDEIVILPLGRHALVGQLKISYYLRPSLLVSESRVCKITDINTTTGVITVDKVPSNLTTPVEMDFLQTKSPHKRIVLDITPTAVDVTNKTFTFTPSAIPSTLVVGDQLAASEECSIPNIPDDLHSMLAQRVACRCLEALGDQQGLQAANLKLAEMEIKTGQIIDNRVEDAPQKIVNRHGFLRMSRRMLRR